MITNNKYQRNNSELLNADGLDDSISNVNYFSSADGEDGDEEMTEYESEESEVGGGVEQTDLPRFRDLVRAKKLELKAQYGKGRFDNQSTTERQCKTIQVPQGYSERQCRTVFGKQVCINVPKVRMVGQEVCVNVPKIKVVWIAGWRRRWNEFKRAGGLAQLKMQAKGTAPIPSPSVLPDTKPPVRPRPFQVGAATFVQPKSFPIAAEPIAETTTETTTETTSTSPSQGKGDSVPQGKGAVGKSSDSTETTDTATEKKFLGMPKNIGIAVTIVGVAAIGFVAFKMLKKK